MKEIIYTIGQDLDSFFEVNSGSILQLTTQFAIIRNTFEIYEFIKKKRWDFDDEIKWLFYLANKDTDIIKDLMEDIANRIDNDKPIDKWYRVNTARITATADLTRGSKNQFEIQITISTM